MAGGDEQLEVSTKMVRANRKRIILLAAAFLILAGTSVGILISHRQTSLIPDEFLAAAKTTGYPLYYPTNLPPGYYFKAGSLHASPSAVVFTITSADGNPIAVTEQAKPSGFDFSQLSGTDEFQTSLGNAYVEDFETRTTGSIVANKTWIIINTNNPVGSDAMKQVLASFISVVH